MEGAPVRDRIYADLAPRIAAASAAGHVPTLATLVVGDDPASLSYVRGKVNAAEKLGIASIQEHLPSDAGEARIRHVIDEWNHADGIDGILVQLPLPSGYDTAGVQQTVRADKDVDGFHPANMGALALKGFSPMFVSCTPAGVMEMLAFYGIDPAGARAVVLGRSNIVGMPMALLLTKADATVTIAHSRTGSLPELCRQADILVVAIGKPRFVTASMVKEGAVVVDVGINRVDDRLVGDVAFDDVRSVAAALTPVPKGVGPLTVAMLMHNVVVAAERKAG
ncbi:bifunctional 5,10-methylenetetrahydrofolate dehydrogenase/5,10-methenyltetrahydrofolate cyclohydrolase [Candidatus Fermentibacteria bacterium]|nr:bifunctional 5,10-methylenetetrahydrofolate dehydrogenase/5,10-methenyltetrahydrofolate cyclohydrolase [Candidatus Fermentibacteria bacterium]